MNTIQNLVLASIDGSPLTDAVCDYAAWIAQKVDAPLKLLHTIDHHPEHAHSTDITGNIGVDSRDRLLDQLTQLEQQRSKLRLQQGKQLLQAARERAMQAGVLDPITNQRHGSLVESLIELENELRVLVIGVRGKVHENQADKIGAKLESIIRSLHKPILVVNAEFKAPERIMLAYDGSQAAEKALEMVAASPLYKGLTCHLVCVSQDEGKGQLLDVAANKLRLAGGIEVIAKRLIGKPEQVLCDYQDQHGIDLTEMGTFRHTRIHDWLLGSVTVKMLTHSRKPLLLLR
ncbi:UspA domain-containing protein [Methylomonas albis]|uniref:Universal stress protein n=1 Tax=Methylomonas albis TaxID=1854563 RepID=A0ABR9D4U3_9GAMM|nr:universal stress protein [Methylomonas albis]MBD9356902.1 universal stress protein [Methylomonas albis]CAD6880085.1 UspA domain-containing protein [Methylomonas albis]